MFDVGIIGAGPAGYIAAIKAAQKGLSVVLFEKQHIGGTCLNKGCIPTKTILHSTKLYSEAKNLEKFGIKAENISFDFAKIQERQKTVAEKIQKNLTLLIKSYGITIIEEEAHIEKQGLIKTATNNFEVKNIIIATGSKPNKFKLNGNYAEDFIMTSDDVLNLMEIPNSIMIVGSGAIGVEWARIFSALGVKVYIVEMMENLIPIADIDISDRILKLFKRSRMDCFTSTTINNIDGNKVTLSNGKTIEVDKILLGAGRLPEVNIGKNEIKVNKFVEIDDNFKTNVENIYAIGDINGKSMLAHSAMKQAENVINYIVDNKCEKFDNNLVPSVIYGSPEIAWIGKTEQTLIKENLTYKKSIFPISALGKAYAENKIDGFIKVLANDNEILGAHIISEEASAMVQQFAITMANKLSPKDLHKVIFAHPTYSEGVAESILGLDNIALHLPKVNL